MKPSEARKSNKPIMEKRRRARINNCLNELKALILDALKKDPSRHSKLEKADILDMTVKYLQSLQRQQMAMAVAADPSVISKFRAGFGECANEVSRFVTRADGVDPTVRQRLLGHLSHYLKNLHTLSDNAGTAVTAPTPLSLAGFQLPAMMQAAAAVSSPAQISNDLGQTSAATASTLFRGLQLIPTRLPNGEILFLLPSSFTTAAAAAATSAPTPTSQPLSVDVASSPPSSASTAPLSSTELQDSPTSAVAQDLTRKLSMSPFSDTSYTSPASAHEDQGSTMTSPNGKDPWRPW